MPFKYDLTLLKSRQNLLDFLGVDEAIFEKTLSFDPQTQRTQDLVEEALQTGAIRFIEIPLFFRHEIPKKNWRRGYRTAWEPTALKNHYKALARRLNNFFSYNLVGFPHPRAFGYVSGRNIRENALDHCGHRYLMSVDLKDFFPSISVSRIAKFLETTGVEPTTADLLSRFVTIGGALPLGLPTSPTLANAICLPMDVELEAFAQQSGATFSRYADDISLSSDTALPPVNEIAKLIKKYEFEVAKEKTRLSTIGQAHYVTGLSISDPAQPHVPRGKKLKLRQELYFSKKFGLDDHFRRLGINDYREIQHEVNRLDGLVKFIAFHEPRLSAQLKTDWAEILRSSNHSPSFEPKNQARTPFFMFVDEAEYARPDGTRLLAIGMAVSQHQDDVNRATLEVLEDALSDQWAAGDRAAIAKRGLHFVDAHPDLRLAYIKRMRSLPFEGYVAMAQLESAENYEAIYIRLLNLIIKRRLMAAESRLAHFAFEKNDKVSQEAIRQAVMNAYSSLKSLNNRHPELCLVDFVGKPHLGISAPDFLLGVLGKFLASGPEGAGTNDRDRKLFESIRDKYRLILDADKRIEYSRRREISPW
jgi:RNA-directed DNA polymerase